MLKQLLQTALAFTPPLMKSEGRYMKDVLNLIGNVIIIFVMSIVIICGMVIDLIDHNMAFILIGGAIVILYMHFKN